MARIVPYKGKSIVFNDVNSTAFPVTVLPSKDSPMLEALDISRSWALSSRLNEKFKFIDADTAMEAIECGVTPFEIIQEKLDWLKSGSTS